MRAKQNELINLRQGQMTVTETVRKFDQLARLCLTLVRTEEDRVTRLLEVFHPELTALIETGEHPPTTMADCVSRALRAEYRVNQSREERAKFYEAKRAQKRQEMTEARNNKASQGGGRASRGIGNKRKGDFS